MPRDSRVDVGVPKNDENEKAERPPVLVGSAEGEKGGRRSPRILPRTGENALWGVTFPGRPRPQRFLSYRSPALGSLQEGSILATHLAVAGPTLSWRLPRGPTLALRFRRTGPGGLRRETSEETLSDISRN